MKKFGAFISVMGLTAVGLLTVLFSLFSTNACSGEITDTNTNVIQNFVVISDPTNGQVCGINPEVIGSGYSTAGIESVTIYASPNYGGFTNSWPTILQAGKITLFRKAVEFDRSAYFYMWAVLSNKNGEIQKSDLMIIYIQE